ncbi:hypothetical protein HYDPIDRAFT_111336 [Hydnomerulius pinastri MD-312]|uniref:GST N-terminal domain-containing protein n=1 Tax=Hydnomerulius pinastri MD-312 TaxID=994086 RepID=A0A0C9WA47_9AGAM|nr:hypothetical protein HYDPIDRAFT_111336 [Hydnomerulius pinastri MD-312]
MAPIGSLYGVTRQRQTKVILAAAAVAGVEVELLPFEFGTTNKSSEFLAVVPYGKIPAFKGNDGVTFIEGAPIARHGKARSFFP